MRKKKLSLHSEYCVRELRYYSESIQGDFSVPSPARIETKFDTAVHPCHWHWHWHYKLHETYSTGLIGISIGDSNGA